MGKSAKKLLLSIPLLYFLFVLLSNILPYCRTVRVSDETRARLDEVNFYGGAGYSVDRVTLLETPTEALEARLAILRSAEHSIDLTCYKAVSGDSVDAVLGELLLAADRGVEVRLLLDGRAGMTDLALKKRLALLNAHPNITFRRYNPVHLLRPWEWHSVLHDKFIVVDDTWLLLGGRNLGDRYYAPAGYTGTVTNDRDVLVRRTGSLTPEDGSVLHQALDHMDALWESRHTVGVREKKMEKLAGQRQDLLASVERFQRDNPRFYAQTLEDYSHRMAPAKQITLLTNPLHTGKKQPELAWQMRRIALTAKERVMVQTPYSTANRHLLATMEEVCGQADTVMLTNSLASTPNFPAFSNYYSQRDSFARTGLRIYEYQSTDSIHGKSMIVDDRIAVVGSFNLDDRSMYIDTESVLVIDSEEFSGVLLDAMEEIRSQSLPVDSTGRGYDPGQGLEPVATGKGREILIVLASLFSRLFQFLI